MIKIKLGICVVSVGNFLSRGCGVLLRRFLIKLFLRPEKSHKTRILIITDVFRKMGGSERNITQLLHGMDQTRFQICVACLHSGELAQAARGRDSKPMA